MSTQSTSSESNSVIPLAPRARTAVSDVDQLDKAGQTILGLLHKRPAWLKRTADTRWTWRRNFRISFARQRIGSQS